MPIASAAGPLEALPKMNPASEAIGDVTRMLARSVPINIGKMQPINVRATTPAKLAIRTPIKTRAKN